MTSAQFALDLERAARATQKAARPLGPFPVDSDRSVLWPVVDRRAPDGVAWTRVDAGDYRIVASMQWHCEKGGYCVAHRSNGRVRIALHDLIMRPAAGLVVDHIHGDTKDNRRCSLRVVTKSMNSANLRLSRVGRCSARFRGITIHRLTGKWQAAANHRGRCISGGLYRREEDAAAAYDRLAARLWPGIVPRNIPHINPEESLMRRTVHLQLEKTTRGAVRYREVDAQGQPLDQGESVIGTLYVRKSALAGAEPGAITVIVDTQAA